MNTNSVGPKKRADSNTSPVSKEFSLGVYGRLLKDRGVDLTGSDKNNHSDKNPKNRTIRLDAGIPDHRFNDHL